MAINPTLGNELTAARRANRFSPEVLARYTTDLLPPFHCNVVEGACQKEFEKPGSLITHCNRKHLGTVNPNLHRRNGHKRTMKRGKFECPECHLPFKRRATLTLHIRKVHGKSIKDYETATDYPCPHKRCDRAPLKSRAGLTRHLREMHGGKQPRAVHSNGHSDKPLALRASATVLTPVTPVMAFGRQVVFCPCCGINIPLVQKAINFGEGQ